MNNLEKYNLKITACNILSEKKTINKTVILNVANNLGINFYSLLRAWKNYEETSGKFIDRRVKSGEYFGEPQFHKENIHGMKTFIKKDEAKKIFLEYLQTEIGYKELLKKYNLNQNTFFKWREQLTSDGTFYGIQIFDYMKQNRVNICDAIWLCKHPKTTRKSLQNLSPTEKMYYRNIVSTIIHKLQEA